MFLFFFHVDVSSYKKIVYVWNIRRDTAKASEMIFAHSFLLYFKL